MRMIPERVDPDTQSDAEKRLFRQLRHLDDPRWTVALHSLNLSEHLYQQMGEIDFLLICPHGILVLEVKGGRIAFERGVWKHTTRYGKETRRRKGPFDQARTAMFSLRERLERIDPGLVRGISFGFGVVFPDIVFDATSVEWSEEMILDKDTLNRPDGLLRGLNRLGAYWLSKPGDRGRRLSPTDVDKLTFTLRPDYDVVPTLGRTLRELEIELASLTETQYRGLDAHTRNPRIIYEGGAGTGKTLLAAEMARRSAKTGARVLFTCHSAIIAGFVSAQPGMDAIKVVPFNRLNPVPEAEKKFDLLIVDEAQDLVNMASLARLEPVLRGGLQDGNWLFFLDTNNQRGLVGSFEPDAMEYLRLARPAEFVLTDNCRNTSTVVHDVTEITGADVGISTAGAGPDVRYISVFDRTSPAEQISQVLDQLAADEVPADQITLLSTLNLRNSVFSALPTRWRNQIDGVDLATWRKRPPSRLGFARVQDFKGLESPFVILGDIEAESDDGRRAALYVGMTRARVGLVVVLSEEGRAAQLSSEVNTNA